MKDGDNSCDTWHSSEAGRMRTTRKSYAVLYFYTESNCSCVEKKKPAPKHRRNTAKRFHVGQRVVRSRVPTKRVVRLRDVIRISVCTISAAPYEESPFKGRNAINISNRLKFNMIPFNRANAATHYIPRFPCHRDSPKISKLRA